MAVGAILYLWSHPIFVRNQWKRKCHPKFAQMQWKLPRFIIIIGATIKIESAYMRLCMCTGPVVVRGFYDISMNYLRYFCELFMLFVEKTEPQFIACIPHRGLECWTEILINARERNLT
jgi:hypothetical protein